MHRKSGCAHHAPNSQHCRALAAGTGSGSFVVGILVAIASRLPPFLRLNRTAPRRREGARRTAPRPAGLRHARRGAGRLAAAQSSEDGRYVEAPRLGTDIDLMVSGPTARARVTQMFHNPTDGWVEAVYVYPLPEGGAVDTLKMVIGDRIVVGEIKEREQAREIYEQAKAAGQQGEPDRAGAAEHLHQLGRQYRPGRDRGGADRIPGAGAPVRRRVLAARAAGRGAALHSRADGADGRFPRRRAGLGHGRRDPVPDRDRIEPPVLDPRWNIAGQSGRRSRCACRPASRSARSRAITTRSRSETAEDGTRVIKLAEGPVPADRDFELTWKPPRERAPSVGLFRERVGDADYLLAFVTPPRSWRSEDRRPREIVFVIDNSGSMGGTSIVQAKASLVYALGRLHAGRPLQRDPLRQHDGRAVPRHGAGRRRARRAGQGLRRGAAGAAAAPRWCRR